MRLRFLLLAGVAAMLLGCGDSAPSPTVGGETTAFVGARVIADASASPIENGVLVLRDGRVEAVGAAGEIVIPPGARTVDLSGKVVIPGLISGHVHVSDVNGLEPRAFTHENTVRQLAVFARYGITAVLSLGDEKAPAFALRDQQDSASLNHARVFLSGDIVTANTVDAAREQVATVATMKPDWIKIRVDDNLGTGTKMRPEVYRAVIEEAHSRGLRLAAHVHYLDDAKDLLRAGADMVAHSVRDQEIDAEFIQLMKERNIPYCPTLTRELSTFVYAAKPAFFDDPFFLREANKDVVEKLLTKESQEKYRNSKAGQAYKAALEVAKRNLKKASDAGLLVVMGTDSGPTPERFQGYFEHLEMEMMAESGMSARAILESATKAAATALRRDDLGVLKKGAWGDFVVLEADPLEDIGNLRKISEVRIAGNVVPNPQ